MSLLNYPKLLALIRWLGVSWMPVEVHVAVCAAAGVALGPSSPQR